MRQTRPRVVTEESVYELNNNDNENGAQAMSTPNRRNYIGLPAMVKLAPLPIKSFSGKLVDWPEFKATCESTFTNIMDEVNRFRYLKSHLSDEPYRLIKHLPLMAGNYDRAFELLKKRYDNERAIINANLNRLVKLPVLKIESANDLKYIVDITNECISALNGYNINTDLWSSMLIFLLTQRLDSNSIKQWEKKIQGQRTVPPHLKLQH